MIIRKYGIELHRLAHEDIETVRQARNRDDIRSKMFDQRIISPEQQESWFQSIDNAQNLYFIIRHKARSIGLIHGKNIDWDKRQTEGGIFLWDNDYAGTGIAAKASILLAELSFSIIDLERVYARVHPDNPSVYQYNLGLGYEPTSEPNRLILTRASHEAHITRLRKLASGRNNSPPLCLDDFDFADYTQNAHFYQSLPDFILQKVKQRLSQH